MGYQNIDKCTSVYIKCRGKWLKYIYTLTISTTQNMYIEVYLNLNQSTNHNNNSDASVLVRAMESPAPLENVHVASQKRKTWRSSFRVYEGATKPVSLP